MSFQAGRLNLRCFIDGIEVPIIGARCSFTEGMGATAQCHMVFTDQLHDLKARSMVQLFVYENDDYTTDDIGTTRARRLSPLDPRRYKMLFEGDLAGIQFSQNNNQRQATLIAVDHTNYWEFIRQHYVNFGNAGVELFENAFLGVNLDRIKNFDVTTKDAHSNLYVWLTSQGELNGGVHRAIREMFFAANDFYAQAFNRHRMNDKIVGLPNDQTAAKLFKLDFFEKFVKNQIGGQGGMVTMKQLIDTLLGIVYHTYVTVPFPRFDTAGGARVTVFNESDEISSSIIARAAYPNATCNYTIIKPDTSFLVPPVCNILFPHQYTSADYQRNYLDEPTRLFLRTSLMFTGQDKWLTERFYAPDFSIFDELLNRNGGYLTRNNTLVLPHERFAGLNPMFMWQNDVSAYVQKGARREYLAKLADYLFWKMRFQGRALNISGPLNMNMVPGYPALVMAQTGGPREFNKHYMGNLHTMTHVIDQNGGWTHATLTSARLHDEVIDLDEGGQSLEDITSRGTDGFLDDRYEQTRIGDDVYQLLFGVGSLLDIPEVLEDVTQFPTLVTRAVGNLQELYRNAKLGTTSLHTFTAALQHRPKADMVQILGLTETLNIGDDSASAGVLNHVRRELAEDPNATEEGFMSVAVDPNAGDFDSDTYVSKATTTSFTRVTKSEDITTVVSVDSDGDGVDDSTETIRIPLPEQSVLQARVVPEGTEGTYGLAVLLAERQAFVRAYIDSLRFRGLRG